GLLIGVIGYNSAAPLLTMLGTPGEAYQLALDYLRVVFIAMPVIMVTVIVTMAMRGAGDARTPLIFMLVAVVLDVGLNPLFIAGIGPFPELGIVGSGVAMLIANVVSLTGLLTYIYVKDLPLRLRGAELTYLRPRGEELRYIVAKGFPMGAQMLIMSAAGIIMIGLVNQEGLLMAAAYGASLQLFTYVQMPAMAIGGAVSSMAAQYIGARKWDVLNQVSRAGVLINIVITGTMALITVVFDIPLLSMFLGGESEALPLAAHIMLIASWNFVFFGVTMVYSGTMRAAGAVWMPLLIVVVALYPARLGFYYLTYEWLGSDAIWWSFSVGGVVATILALLLYYFTNWRGHAQA
ncbi:MAG: MATE family efflux transporter, partial [Proteobacteria bacterium]